MTKKSDMWRLAYVVCVSFMTLNLVACHPGSSGSASDEKTVISEALITDKMVNIDGTPKTPTINFNAETGVLEMKGRSIPENSTEFYKLLAQWLDNYSKAPAKITQLNIWFSTLNPGSTKALMAIFQRLEGINNSGSPVMICWHYSEGNLDMLEAGKKYRSIINVPFKMVQVAERMQ